MKTQKSFSKRIRVTKNGKVVRRPMRLDHFKTTKSKKNLRGKRKARSLNYPLRGI
jgi:ribosomal protein L35